MHLLTYLFVLIFCSSLSAGSKEAFINFKQYQNKQWLTDFMIITNDGSKYHCHKIILANISSYFEAMFSINMTESQTNTLKLPYTKETMDIIIDFIYDPDKTTMDKDIT